MFPEETVALFSNITNTSESFQLLVFLGSSIPFDRVIAKSFQINTLPTKSKELKARGCLDIPCTIINPQKCSDVLFIKQQ